MQAPAAARKLRKGRSEAEIYLEEELKRLKIPYRAEMRFCPERKWRTDFFLPGPKVALEINGGTWSRGRHNRGSSVQAEYEKLNEMAVMGYRLLQFTTDDVMQGRAMLWVRRALGDAAPEVKWLVWSVKPPKE